MVLNFPAGIPVRIDSRSKRTPGETGPIYDDSGPFRIGPVQEYFHFVQDRLGEPLVLARKRIEHRAPPDRPHRGIAADHEAVTGHIYARRLKDDLCENLLAGSKFVPVEEDQPWR